MLNKLKRRWASFSIYFVIVSGICVILFLIVDDFSDIFFKSIVIENWLTTTISFIKSDPKLNSDTNWIIDLQQKSGTINIEMEKLCGNKYKKCINAFREFKIKKGFPSAFHNQMVKYLNTLNYYIMV